MVGKIIRRMVEKWRAGELRRLEANVRYHAVTYAMAKARYENALIADKLKGEEG